MTISGVILTLVDDPNLADEAMQWIQGAPELTLGHIDGARIAVVAETSDPRADRRLFHTLNEQRGIAHVDITSVFFDDDAMSSNDDSAGCASVSRNTTSTPVTVHKDEE